MTPSNALVARTNDLRRTGSTRHDETASHCSLVLCGLMLLGPSAIVPAADDTLLYERFENTTAGTVRGGDTGLVG